ncbi:MAG: hypothetical protein AABZ53_09480 [Planctomycetota bacterium]
MTRSILWALLTGVGVNAVLAQLVGWFPMKSGAGVWCFVKVEDEAGEVFVTRGFGRQSTTMRLLPAWGAAMWQGIRDKKPAEAMVIGAEPDYAPAGAVPGWCSVWSVEGRARERLASATAKANGELQSQPLDVGIGVPFISFSASMEPRALPASGLDPVPVVHGGIMTDPIRAGSDGVKVLAWRPVFPGFVSGSLFWSAVAMGVLLLVSKLRTRSRRLGKRCLACGYELAGLAVGERCPECGVGSEAQDPASGTTP